MVQDEKKQSNGAGGDDKSAAGSGGDAAATGASGGAGGAGGAAAAGVIREDDKAPAEEPDSPDGEDDRANEPLWKVDSKDSKSGGKQHGKLLTDILAAQEQEAGADSKMTRIGGKSASAAANANRLLSAEQLAALRAAVQKVCQSANPLGKCIDFVYDDMDQMSKELTRWKRAYTQYNEKYEEEKQQTQALLTPLQNQIKAADASLQSQLRKIQSLKAAILRNDQTIANSIEQHSASS